VWVYVTQPPYISKKLDGGVGYLEKVIIMSYHKVMTPSSNSSRGRRRTTSILSPSSPGKFTRLEFEDEAVYQARKILHKKLVNLEKVIRIHTTPRKEGSVGVGAGHPMIVAAKKELQRLQNQEKQLRWTALVCWHKQNLEEAELEVKQGGDLEILNRAVQEACDSDLGPVRRSLDVYFSFSLWTPKIKTHVPQFTPPRDITSAWQEKEHSQS